MNKTGGGPTGARPLADPRRCPFLELTLVDSHNLPIVRQTQESKHVDREAHIERPNAAVDEDELTDPRMTAAEALVDRNRQTSAWVCRVLLQARVGDQRVGRVG